MSQTYAKIGVYCGITAPMHWHEPYNYWQWAFEKHGKPGADHALHNVGNPIWVDAKVSNPTKAGVKRHTATADEKRWYKATLNPDSPESQAIKAAYKTYLAGRAGATEVVPAAPVPTLEQIAYKAEVALGAF